MGDLLASTRAAGTVVALTDHAPGRLITRVMQ